MKAAWELIIRAKLDNKSVSIPPLYYRDAPYFLELWLNYRIHTSKEKGEVLDQVAVAAGLEQVLVRILTRPFLQILPPRIWLLDMALLAAEWIHAESILRQVRLRAESGNQYIAVKACSCLAALNAPGFDRAVIRTLFRFPGKTPYYATHISRTGGAEVFKILAPFLDKLPEYVVLNFISLAERSQDITLLPLLEMRLGKTRNTNEIAALLRVIGKLGSEKNRELVLPYVQSESPVLRSQALKALGEFGIPSDLKMVLPFMADNHWWVRYRAARAVLKLCGNDREVMARIRSGLSADIAIEMWDHVVTKDDWCLT